MERFVQASYAGISQLSGSGGMRKDAPQRVEGVEEARAGLAAAEATYQASVARAREAHRHEKASYERELHDAQRRLRDATARYEQEVATAERTVLTPAG